MGLQERIKTLQQNGHKEAIESFLAKLETKAKLPKELKEKLESLGNTPIAEPEIYKLAEDNADLTDILLEVFKSDENSKQQIAQMSKDLGLDAMILFARLLVKQVTSFENDDGSVKSTPSTANCDFPDIFQVRDYNKKQSELMEMFKSYSSIKSDTRAIEDMNDDEVKEMNKKMQELNEKTTAKAKELENMVLEFSGLNIEVLTEWEKQLVQHNINKYIQKAYKDTILGKQ